MKEKIIGSKGGPWSTETHKQFYPRNFNKGLADFIVSTFTGDTVLEFGSGLGYLARYLKENSTRKEYFCIEPNRIEGEYDRVKGLDLLAFDIFSQVHPQEINKKFDLVISIEVAEHVERSMHDELFDFLTSHANKWLIFSGASIGQGGIGHIAERNLEDWRSEFTRRGFIFVKELTDSARNACDEKNINHRNNLMVFKRPDHYFTLDLLEKQAKPYFSRILEIVKETSSYMTGNLCYVSLRDAENGMPKDSLKIKRDNFQQFIQQKKNVLMLGFNAGHSTVLGLLANKIAKFTVIDICEFAYTKGCMEFLEKSFPGRIKFIEGDTVNVLPSLLGEKFDFIHVDAGKEKTIEADLNLIKKLAAKDHIIIVDDVQNKELNERMLSFADNNNLDLETFLAHTERCREYKWRHALCRFDEGAESKLVNILRRLSSIYSSCNFPSIYTCFPEDSVINSPGYKRAASFLALLQDISSRKTRGDCVECGVEAGHVAAFTALCLLKLNNLHLDLYLYDTFEDASYASSTAKILQRVGTSKCELLKPTNAIISKKSVISKVTKSGWSQDRIKCVRGQIKDTIPKVMPDRISILRLELGQYPQTLHVLEHMFPRLVDGGYLIIDDYGYNEESKKAVDDFFIRNNLDLQRLITVDYTCRIYLNIN